MDPFDWLKKRWQEKAIPSTYVHVDPSHVDLGDGRVQDATALAAGEHYFRLWLVAMSLEDDRKWFAEWMPAAYSLIKFRFGDQDVTVSHVAGQSMLSGLDETAVGRRVGLNYAMTALAPFNGGSVEIETGLVAVPGRNDVAALMTVLGKFSQVIVVPQLSAVLSTAKVVGEGLAELVDATDARPVLRFHNTMTAGETAGANRLRGGYFLVASAPEGEIDPSQLWIVRDRPFYGATAAAAKPLTGCHYLLFRIEAPTTRDDWESLTSIQQPFQQALLLLQQAAGEFDDDLRRRLMQLAERQRDAAKFAALRAPELTQIGGRNQVVDGILRSYEQASRVLGRGLAENETAAPRTLGGAVRRGMPAAQAIALGELPVRELMDATKPLERPATVAPPTAARPRSGMRRGGTTAQPAGTTTTGALERTQPLQPRPMDRAAPPAEVRIEKTPHMAIAPEAPLVPAQTFTVTVTADDVAARAGEEISAIDVTVGASTTRVELEVWIAGTSHFEFPGPRVKPFVIDRASGSPPSAEFEVKVRSDVDTSSVASLSANFSYQGRPSGRVTRRIEIVAGAEPMAASTTAAAIVPAAIRVDATAKLADLTIEVLDPDNTTRHLECRISSPHLHDAAFSEPFAWDLSRSTADLVKSFMAEFVKPDIDEEERLLNLKGAGRQLWDAVPRTLQDAFWALVDLDKLDTIRIASEEPYIPWELMIPRRGQKTRPPLGSEYVIGRWFPRNFDAPPQALALSTSLVVAPAYGPPPEPPALEFAGAEEQLVLATVAGESVTPATSAAVRTRLVAGSATLVHFVCHGVDSTTFGVQAIELKGGQLTSLQIDGMDELRQAFSNRPLVFLNACEIGRLSPALVGVGGFAKAFLDAGAGAVIAPLWSVKDSIAHEIAETFYQRLKSGGRVRPAEILRDVRRKAYGANAASSGEDTYAAYCFYGDPEAIAFIPSEGGRS
jgi:hypothetical protein